ncbi:MAG: haloalkane dehalogenase [Pseudomonadota bacterium]
MTRRQMIKTATLAAGAGVTLPAPLASAQTPSANAPYGLAISAEFPFEKKRVDVNGAEMAYVDEGEGSPVLFLHGNPTSSYLWRNIIPYVTDGHRAIALDLIGMGDSDKPRIGYTFADHAAYMDEFIATLGLSDITLVVHDWGSALGMRYARMNAGNVRAIAFMEAIVPPGMPIPSCDAMGPQVGDLFRALRTPEQGEEMVLQGNFFVEEILPKMGVMRGLTEAEMKHYRAPYPTPESRLPTLEWPREVPIGGTPADVLFEVEANGDWLYSSQIPKLLFYASPGILTPQQVVDHMVQTMPNLESQFVGPGLHFIQEDHPDQIGTGLRDWLRRLQA